MKSPVYGRCHTPALKCSWVEARTLCYSPVTAKVEVGVNASGLPVRAGEVFGGDLPGTDVTLMLYVQRGL